MGRKNALTQNYFFDPVAVNELGAEICSVMTQMDGILEEASGVIGEISALAGSVPSKARCGALLDACAMAQSEIRSVDFLSYGHRVNNGLLNMTDHNAYISDKFIQAMRNNSERAQGFGSGCRSLSALLEYVGGTAALNIKYGLNMKRAESDTPETEEESRTLTRTEFIQQMAVKKSGVQLVEGVPHVNGPIEAEKARRYYHCLNEYRNASNSVIAAELAGLNHVNGIPIINSGFESQKYMEAMATVNSIFPKFVGYLSYGADGIEQNGSAGFFRLYDKPTLDTEVIIYNCGDLYEQYEIEPNGALQSFCEREVFNMENPDIKYGGQQPNVKKGTLIYNGIERYAIAIGPTLQNPEFKLVNNKIQANEMIYGTCVDISIVLEGNTYYIPALIVDVKANTANGGEGIFQTGYDFEGNYVDTGAVGPIVEWYVVQETEAGNKAEGLKQFNRNASIIIYQEEVLR